MFHISIVAIIIDICVLFMLLLMLLLESMFPSLVSLDKGPTVYGTPRARQRTRKLIKVDGACLLIYHYYYWVA